MTEVEGQCDVFLAFNIIAPSLDSFEHNPVKLSKKNMTASRIKQFYKTMTSAGKMDVSGNLSVLGAFAL